MEMNNSIRRAGLCKSLRLMLNLHLVCVTCYMEVIYVILVVIGVRRLMC